ncbi:MAG TPA: aminoglycoside phosphotransferase family protein [Bacteroidales bacterium]|nr:aminoglycoside phosphotransferase family protein [Bacteroidales bacterium]
MKHIISQFIISGTITDIIPFGSGHIHGTFLAKGSTESYILQQINTRVFRDPVTVMKNISLVTDHIRKKLEESGAPDITRSVLTVIPIKTGDLIYTDENKKVWRCFVYIPRHKTYDKAVSEDQVYEGGKAYGKFLNQLSDLPAANLGETIRGFHDMEMRIRQFEDACKNGVPERIKETSHEINLLRERKDEMIIIRKLGREDKINTRIVHHDTKINNVLFDEDGKGLCVIDLDTVMPGFIHDDFGDSIRTFTNTGDEDDSNVNQVSINMKFYEAYAAGFLEQTRNVMNDVEKDHLALSAKALTYMQSLRFLTDHLNGDIYYHINHEGHNLQRTRAQVRLLLSMEEHYDQMKEIIHKLS